MIKSLNKKTQWFYLQHQFPHKIFSDGLLIAFGQLAQAIAMLFGIRLLSELVSPKVYGKVTLLMGTVLLGRQIFAFPFLQAALRFYPEALQDNFLPQLRRIIKSYLFTIIGGYTLLYLIGGLIYSNYNNSISYYLFIISSALLCFEVACVLETDLFNAARMQRHFVFFQVVHSWLRPLCAILLIMVFGATAISLISGYLTASILVLVFLYMLPIDRVGVEQANAPSITMPKFKQDIWQYALPLIPLALVGWISTFGDRYIIGALVNVEQVGIYAVAYSLMSLPFTMVQAVLERTLRPVYFNAISAGDKKKAKMYFNFWLYSVFYVCFAGVLIAYFFHYDIAKLFLAEKYRGSAQLMPWIALGHLFLAMSFVFEKPCLAYKKTTYILIIRGTGTLFSLLVTIPFILHYGLAGAAMAVPIYFFLQLCTSGIICRKISGKHHNK